MNKKLLVLLIGLIAILAIGFVIISDMAFINVYMDGENISTSVIAAPFLHDTSEISREVNEYALKTGVNDLNSNITGLKDGINNITKEYGINNANIKINSPYGEDKIPILFIVEGTSMVPTLEDGQDVIVLKTKDINIGDIVVSNDSEYGIIVKRVSQIDGYRIYLTSDNTNIEIVYINGVKYEKEGIKTWNNYSNIVGVVKEY